MNQQAIQLAIQQVMPLARATGLFVSLCTLQQPDGILTGAGQPSGNYVNVPGLVNIACMDAPLSEARIQASEIKGLDEIEAFAPRHILLSGYYPQIAAGVAAGWQVVVDGTALDLMGAESDSQAQMTRIVARTSGL